MVDALTRYNGACAPLIQEAGTVRDGGRPGSGPFVGIEVRRSAHDAGVVVIHDRRLGRGQRGDARVLVRGRRRRAGGGAVPIASRIDSLVARRKRRRRSDEPQPPLPLALDRRRKPWTIRLSRESRKAIQGEVRFDRIRRGGGLYSTAASVFQIVPQECVCRVRRRRDRRGGEPESSRRSADRTPGGGKFPGRQVLSGRGSSSPARSFP